MEGLVRRDRMFDAGNVRRHPNAAANGNQDLIRRDHPILTDQLNAVRIQKPGLGHDQLGPRLGQVGNIHPRKPSDLRIFARQKGRPVKGRGLLRQGPAKALRSLESMAKFRGIDHELFGHAAANDAGTADPVLFGDRHPSAGHGRQSRRPHAARPGTDHKQVVVMLAHGQVLWSKEIRVKTSASAFGHRQVQRPAPHRRDQGKDHGRQRRLCSSRRRLGPKDQRSHRKARRKSGCPHR